jgi:hypothetical protein
MQLSNLFKGMALVAIMSANAAYAAAVKIPPHAKLDSGENIASPKDLNWLKGNWTASGAKGSVQIKASGVGDDKYIYMTFLDDKNSVTELQIIGFSPKVKTVISWSYDGDGGFGKSLWKKDGADWIVKSISGQLSGKKGMAKYRLHKIDDNNFTWKSTMRSFDGKRLPDTAEVTVTRSQ